MSSSPSPPPGEAPSDETLAFVAPSDAAAGSGPVSFQQTMFPEDLWSEVADAPVPSSEAYTLISLLGEGGMGEVWEASQRSLHRTVAVKFVRDAGNLRLRRQFAHEANLTAGLSHPNILPVYDLVEIKGRTALVMKRVHGEAWDVHLRRHREAGTLDLAVEVQRLVQVCNAVVAAHEGGVLHLDIKPDNVMVGAHGEVLLADWGCAAVYAPSDWTRAAGLPETASIREIAGTPGFMSPEQAAGAGAELGPQTDVYLLGATLYTVLEGRGLRDSTTLEELLAAIAQPVELSFSATTPRSLQQLCEASLSVDPGQRPETAAAFRDALQHWLDHRASEALVLEADLRVAQAEETGDGAWGAWTAALQLCQQALVLSPDSALASAWVATAHGRLAVLALDRQEPGLAREHAEALAEGAERRRLLADATALHRSQQQSRRAQRWLRRVSAGAAVLVTAALVLVSVFYTDSQRALRQAEALSDFNGRILSGIQPEVAAGLDTDLLEAILHEAEADAATTFADEPALRAEVLAAIGQAYLSVERRDEALAAFQDALALQRGVFGEDSLEALAAELRTWQAGNPSDWGTVKRREGIRSLVDRADALGASAQETRQRAMVLLVWSLQSAGEYDEALLLVEEMLRESARTGVALDNELAFELRRQQALVLGDLGQQDRAIALSRRLVEEVRSQEGAEAWAVYVVEVDQVEVLTGLGLFEEAIALLEELEERALASHRLDSALADLILDQRWSLLQSARAHGFADVERLVERYADKETARVKDTDADQRSVSGWADLTAMLRVAGQPQKLVALTDAVLAAHPRDEVRRQRPWFQMMSNRASALGKLGRSASARAEYEALLQAATTELGWDDRTTMSIRNNLGFLLFGLGDSEGAARLHLDNLKAREKALGRDHTHTAYSAINAAAALEALGDVGRAEELAERVVETMTVPGGTQLLIGAAKRLASLGKNARSREVLLGVKTEDPELAMLRDCLLLSAALALEDAAGLGPAQQACRNRVLARDEDRSADPDTLPWRVLIAEATAIMEGPAAGRAAAEALLAAPPEGDWEASLSTDARASLDALRRLAGR